MLRRWPVPVFQFDNSTIPNLTSSLKPFRTREFNHWHRINDVVNTAVLRVNHPTASTADFQIVSGDHSGDALSRQTAAKAVLGGSGDDLNHYAHQTKAQMNFFKILYEWW